MSFEIAPCHRRDSHEYMFVDLTTHIAFRKLVLVLPQTLFLLLFNIVYTIKVRDNLLESSLLSLHLRFVFSFIVTATDFSFRVVS